MPRTHHGGWCLTAVLAFVLASCSPSPEGAPEGDRGPGQLSRFAASLGWSTSAPLASARGSHTATLLPNGKVLVAGGDGATGMLASTELYDAATGAWASTGSLAQARSSHTATLLPGGKVLVVGGSGASGTLASAELYDVATGTWTSTGPLAQARSHHTATLLPNGKVLVAGGSGASGTLASAELYDVATGTWASTGSLAQARFNHTATLLPTGKVLVAGGEGLSGSLAGTELYDVAAGTWAVTGSLAQARYGHAATLMPQGKVLVAGGEGINGRLPSVELYDAATGSWSSPPSALSQARALHTATLLPHGKVLVVGGFGPSSPLASTELYDAPTGSWANTTWPPSSRYYSTATLLPTGKVLMVGGRGDFGYVTSVVLYEPATGAWTSTGSLAQDRAHHTATLLPHGKVLVVGGSGSSSYLPSATVYDPATGTWSATGSLAQGRYRHTATLLLNGKVLVVGGEGSSGKLSSAAVYDPATGTWTATGSLARMRSGHTATLLLNGKVLVAGGYDGSSELALSEVYDPATGTWAATGSLTKARYSHTATLLPNGKVLAVSGHGATSYMASAEVYDPATGTWTATGSLAQGRSAHTATLLPTGKVLVAGGAGSSENGELYDPATGTWTETEPYVQYRYDHTATLLPNGKVLMSGGLRGGFDTVTSAQEYEDTGSNPAWRPGIASVSPGNTVEIGSVFTVNGSRLRGLSEASGGDSRSSATDFPLLTLLDIERGVLLTLPARDFSRTQLSARVPTVSPGQYLLSVTVNGLTSGTVLQITGDLTPPDTSITAAPAASTTQSSASFTFSASEAGVTFECRLDGAAFFSACTSPATYTNLAEGMHSFQVRARDAAGNADTTPATHSWRIDVTPPDTSITAAPAALTNQATATFTFSSNETGGSFECSLDGAAFTACASPATSANLSEGTHSFQVRARDAAGNLDATPASHSWQVDLTKPDTALTAAPATPTTQTSASFTFSSNDTGASFECSLDGAAFSACTSPATYTHLAEGMHSFQVRARDVAGNVDASPAAHSWQVDLTAPDTSITAAPANPTNQSTASFSFSASEASVSFECRLDGAAFTACTSPVTYANLAEGMHAFQVRARDAVGYVDASAASHTWHIDLAPPDTSITAAPAALTHQATASFTFSSNDAGASFECSLDGAAFSACTSPTTSANLSEGMHAFQVRARDAAGNVDATPASHAWQVDLTAPDTSITAAPANPTNQATASFSFSASEAGVSFECSLDEAAFSACTSPTAYANLAEGTHAFQVRARDAAGNMDTTAASHTWRIDVTPPDTSINAAPANPTNQSTASFSFSSSEVGVSFECSLDGAAFTACTSPTTSANLSEGAHAFQVRARDAAGYVDATPAAHSWQVDLTAPAAPVISSPANGATLENNTPTLSGTAQPGSTVTLTVDGSVAGTTPVDAAGTWSFTPASALADGPHTVTATASDVGGTSAASAPVSFTVATAPPAGSGCGCGAGPGDGSWLLAGLALLAGVASRRRRLA